MNFVTLYYDITKEIEIYELRLLDLEIELKAAVKLMHKGKLPSATHPVFVSLDKAAAQYDIVVEKIQEVSKRLDEKKQIRDRIEENIKDFKGVEHQVAYMRDILLMPLGAIADELGYSYSFISKISSRLKKMMRVPSDIVEQL
ncbi:hypothetical protein ACFSTH_13130 [Paenibacillus yanchengensis]|uniref:Uncharacterized protein n=1 Tax=Paenibacillus yanchengensis TaxID=2035833 RepID=A0ABW4YP40_9BACL